MASGEGAQTKNFVSVWKTVLLLLLAKNLCAASGELTVLHTNDMHAHVLGVRDDDTMCSQEDMDLKKCYGGFDRIFGEATRQRSLSKNTVLLDAGDQFQGSLFHVLYRGIASANFMNQIAYDAMTVGNHEFDDGPAGLKQFVTTIRFPIISANIDVSKSPELKNLIKPYTIIERNGKRIGLVGYTTEDTAYLSSPGEKIRFLPIIESVTRAVKELKAKKVDVIVAISHSGLNRDKEVAKKVSGIAAIVCGHSNSLLSNTHKNADGPSPLVVMSPAKEPVLLVSAYAYGKFLGKLKFSYDQKGVPLSWEAEPILLDHTIARVTDMKAEMTKLYQPIAQIRAKHVGNAAVELEGRSCRFEECVFGNLIADAMADFGRNFGARIALMNGGGIRASIPKGPVSQAHLQDVLPFDKTLVFLKLKGSVIRDIIEHGVAYAEDKANDNTGRFLQVSGLKYSFNSKNQRGKRITDISFIDPATGKFEPLSPSKTYEVVTNSYLANGGDNYEYFKQAKERWSVGVELKELLANFLMKSQSQLPKREGRIVNLAQSETPPLQDVTIN